MIRRTWGAAAFVAALVLGVSSVASADTTLGTTTQPSGGSTAFDCEGATYTIVQKATDPSSPQYVVPSPGGVITSWSTNVAGASPGNQVSLVVLRPSDAGKYIILAVDAETLTTPLPPSNVATFSVPTPIQVRSGDSIAINGPFMSGSTCGWRGGSTPAADQFSQFSTSTPSPPAPGQTIQQFAGTSITALLNVSAVVSTKFDTAVGTSSAPAKPSKGGLALLSSTVTNNGPGSQPITFVDDVPSGLKINSALAANGACTTSAQTVTCTITGLAPGASAPVDIVVTPSALGSYVNHVSVTPPLGFTDPTPGENTATATLNVTNAGPTGCVVPKLRGTPSGVAKRVLKVLGCRVKVKRKKGHGVPKGTVLKTKPRPGHYKFDRKITLIVRK